MSRQQALDKIKEAAKQYVDRDFESMHKTLALVSRFSQFDIVWAQGIMYRYADEMQA